MLLRSAARIASLAFLVTLPASCARTTPCPNGRPAVSVPCHTVVQHHLASLSLSTDRAVAGWTARFGDRVVPLGPAGAWIPIGGGGPEQAVLLEGPLGQTIRLPVPP